mmetsp:Transcript_69147/g.109133  ORF Transcript_69147/g.109133 Transcript_69147/m.109133 type:complete len:211 (+) Transcript_69147:108-740(+)
MRRLLGPFLLLFPVAVSVRDILDTDRDPHASRADVSRQALLQRSAEELQLKHLARRIEDDDDDSQAEEEEATEQSATTDGPTEGRSQEEAGDSGGGEEGNIDRDRDVYAKTAADQADISGAIDAFGSATKKAEQKAKHVDDKLAKYNGRIVELGERLDKLSRAARRYHMQTMRWFKDLEQDKYSPIANMPLDTFKISHDKDDFPLESVAS